MLNIKNSRIRALMLSSLVALALSTVPLESTIAAATTTKISFKSETNSEFVIEGDKQQGTFKDGTKSAKFDVASGQIKIKDNGATIGYITMPEQAEWKIKDANKQDLFTLKQQPDGDYKLKNSDKTLLYKIKPADYGFKVENAAMQTIFKVHKYADKVSLKTADGKEVLSTNASVQPIALVCFALDPLSKQQKAALAYALSIVGN